MILITGCDNATHRPGGFRGAQIKGHVMQINLEYLIDLLATRGYRDGRRMVVEIARSENLERRVVRRGAPDVVAKGRVPAHAIGAGLDSAYSMSSVQRNNERCADAAASSAEDAAHAFCVLAGTYDTQVSAGRATMTVGGEMPALTAAANAYRKAQLSA